MRYMETLEVRRLFNAGSFDTSFDVDGTVLTALPDGNARAVDVAIQADGKILVAAQRTPSAVVRYNSDGSLDTTFGAGGLADGFSQALIKSIALDASGRIVVAGTGSGGGGQDFVVGRYLPDGSADTSFGQDHDGDGTADGWRRVNIATVTLTGPFGSIQVVDTRDTLAGVAIDSAGRIVLGGWAVPFDGSGGGSGATIDYSDFAIARLTPEGALDTTFGDNGTVMADFQFNDWTHAVTVDAADRVLLAGGVRAQFDDTDFAVARFNADGSVDSGFGNGGLAIADITGSYDMAVAIALDDDGRIVVGGDTSAEVFGIGLARFDGDGALDPTFGQGGMVASEVGPESWLTDLAIDQHGRIVAVGGTTADSLDYDAAVLRYTAHGALDISFGSLGVATTDFDADDDGFNAVAIDAEGRVLAAGYTGWGDYPNYRIALARYESNKAPFAAINDFPVVALEGFGIGLSSSVTDFDPGDSHTYAWSAYRGIQLIASGSDDTFGFTPGDNGTYLVLLTVTDSSGASSTDSRTIEVGNVRPTAGPIAPVEPTLVGSSVTFRAAYSDFGQEDTHTAVWNWGDGTSSAGLAEAGVTGAEHTYAAPGVYTVSVVVTDDDGGISQAATYDVTILSPTQAIDQIEQDVAALAETGTLNKYQAGALYWKLQSIGALLIEPEVSVINRLQAFRSSVIAYINGGLLTQEEAQPLLDSANEVLNYLQSNE